VFVKEADIFSSVTRCLDCGEVFHCELNSTSKHLNILNNKYKKLCQDETNTLVYWGIMLKNNDFLVKYFTLIFMLLFNIITVKYRTSMNVLNNLYIIIYAFFMYIYSASWTCIWYCTLCFYCFVCWLLHNSVQCWNLGVLVLCVPWKNCHHQKWSFLCNHSYGIFYLIYIMWWQLCIMETVLSALRAFSTVSSFSVWLSLWYYFSKTVMTKITKLSELTKITYMTNEAKESKVIKL